MIIDKHKSPKRDFTKYHKRYWKEREEARNCELKGHCDCGGTYFADTTLILTSLPPQYRATCNKCKDTFTFPINALSDLIQT